MRHDERRYCIVTFYYSGYVTNVDTAKIDAHPKKVYPTKSITNPHL